MPVLKDDDIDAAFGLKIDSPSNGLSDQDIDSAFNLEISDEDIDSAFDLGEPKKGFFHSAKEVIKGAGRGYVGMAQGLGQATQWLGENIASEEDLEYIDPLGREQIIQIRKGEFQKKVGSAIAKHGKLMENYWKGVMENNELIQPDEEIFKDGFIKNPSWTRALALGMEAIPSLGAAAAITVATKNPLPGAAMLGLVEGSQNYTEAREAGKNIRESNLIGGTSVVGITALEFLPLGRMLRRSGSGRVLRNAVEGAVEEGGQEAAQTLWQNTIAKIGYRPTQDYFEGMADSFVAGVVSGGGANAINAASRRKTEKAIKLMEEAGIDQGQRDQMAMHVANQFIDNADQIEGHLQQNLELFAEQVEKKREVKIDVPQDVQDQNLQTEIVQAKQAQTQETDRIVDVMANAEVKQVPIQQIDTGFRFQIEGRGINEGTADEIARKIREAAANGKPVPPEIDKPILLNRRPGSDTFDIIGGHHRFEGFRRAGQQQIKGQIHFVSDEDAKKIAEQDNIAYIDPPSVRGNTFVRRLEAGETKEEIIKDIIGVPTKINQDIFRKSIAVTHLPGAARELVDTGRIPLDYGAVIGEKIFQHNLQGAISPETILNVYQKYVVEQGVSEIALGNIIDHIHSVASTKYQNKEKQLDLFGQIISNRQNMMDTALELDKEIVRRKGIGQRIRSLKRSAKRGQITLTDETIKDISEQERRSDDRVQELRTRLYQFKLEDFTGVIQKEIGGQTIAVPAETTPDNTVEDPDKSSVEQESAPEFQTNEGVTPDLFPEAHHPGPNDELFKEKQLAKTEKIRATKKRIDDETTTNPAKIDALKKEAERKGDAKRINLILNQKEKFDAQKDPTENPLIKRAIEIREKRESSELLIDSEGREQEVFSFYHALEEVYGINRDDFAKRIEQWLPAFFSQRSLSTHKKRAKDFFPYAWEGAIRAMGANFNEAGILETKFQPDLGKGVTMSDKFFNYSKNWMAKYIREYGLPLEIRNIHMGKKERGSVQSKQINENLHNWKRLMEEVTVEEDIKDLWPNFMPDSVRYSESLVERFKEAMSLSTVSLDADISADSDSGFALIDTIADKRAQRFNDPDGFDYELDKSFLEQDIERADSEINSQEKLLSELDKRIEGRLTGEEAIIFKALTGRHMPFTFTPDEMAEALNGKAIMHPHTGKPFVDLTGAIVHDKVKKRRDWTAGKVTKLFERAMNKLKDDALANVDMFEEGLNRKRESDTNNAGDIMFEKNEDLVGRNEEEQAEIDKKIEKHIRETGGDMGFLFNQKGFAYVPALEDMGFDKEAIQKLMVEPAKETALRADFNLSTPWFLAQRYPNFRNVFTPIVKDGIYADNASNNKFVEIVNAFEGLNDLSKEKAQILVDTLYFNTGKEVFAKHKKLGQDVAWFTADQLKYDQGFDDQMVKAWGQMVRGIRYGILHHRRRFRLANDYYEKRKVRQTDERGEQFDTLETDEQFKERRTQIDQVVRKNFPEVYFPRNRFGNVWVVAKKKIGVDPKTGKDQFDIQYSLVESAGASVFHKRTSAVNKLRERYKEQGYSVEIARKNDLNTETVWQSMDIYQLEQLMEHAGVHWKGIPGKKSPEEGQQTRPDSDLQKLKEYVDRVRASKGGVYGNFLKRDWKPGHDDSTDFFKRSLTHFVTSSSRYMHRYNAEKKARKALQAIPHGEHAPRALKIEYQKTAEWLDNWRNISMGQWQKMRSWWYTYFLGRKLSYFVQNLTQPYFTTYPRLAKEFSNPKDVEGVFIKARYQSARYMIWEKFRGYKGKDLDGQVQRVFGRKIEGIDLKQPPLDEDTMRAMKKAMDKGIITGTFTQMVLGSNAILANQKHSDPYYIKFFKNKDYRRHILNILGLKSERINRMHAFLAGYEAGKRKGLGGDQLFDFATDYVNGTQWAFGSHNWPLWISKQGPNARGLIQTAFLFKTHPYNWMQMVWNDTQDIFNPRDENGKPISKSADHIWKKAFSYYTRLGAVFGTFVGVAGLPLYSVLDKGVQAATGSTIALLIREFIDQLMPDEPEEKKEALARILTTGYVSEATGFDVSGLVGYADIIPVRFSDSLFEMGAGAIYSRSKDMLTYGIPAVQSGMHHGNTVEILRGLEKIVPPAEGNILKSIRTEKEGAVRTRSGDFISDKGGAKEAVGRAMGFRTTDESVAFQKREAQNVFIKRRDKKRKKLLDQLAAAVNRGDRERAKKVRKELAEFGGVQRRTIRDRSRRFRFGKTVKDVSRANRKRFKEIDEKF